MSGKFKLTGKFTKVSNGFKDHNGVIFRANQYKDCNLSQRR